MKKQLLILEKSLETRLRSNRLARTYLFNLLFGATILAIVLYDKNYLIFGIIISIATTLIFFKNQKKSNLNLIQNNVIGNILFDEKNIIIQLKNGRTIKENQINKFRLEYEGFLGEGDFYKLLIYPKYQNYYFGTGNKIEIQTDSDNFAYFIFIESRKEKEIFDKLIEYILSKKIPMKEKFRGKISYGGKILNYQEIQEFKKTISERNL